ncbi:Phosphopantetheine-binding domain protein [Candidatus Thiomargarita nelsonii]|uniref:Phosphopantetheine-binding domain protein n=1 Tax=Candidatus Thiomargarita nelsonii TaxID=1003181 RepID=A0A176S441_9GAMM|nr:Phosphopantetheine-binding domain protein [Candidatus Thiomargarita nelsonii]
MILTTNEVRQAIERAKIMMSVDYLADDMKFADAGVDSLDMFNVILEVQKAASIEIPDDDIDSLDSIENIVSYFQERG